MAEAITEQVPGFEHQGLKTEAKKIWFCEQRYGLTSLSF